MTEVQIKRKAKTYSKNYWYNTNNSVNVASIEKLLIDFATEVTKELEKENAELNEKVNILDNCDRLSDMITEAYKDQLTKSTEIIKKLYAVYYDPCVTESDLKYRDELFAEIKQFLNSEVKNESSSNI